MNLTDTDSEKVKCSNKDCAFYYVHMDNHCAGFDNIEACKGFIKEEIQCYNTQ